MAELLSWILLLRLIQACLSLKIYSPDDQTYAFPLSRFGFNVESVTSLKFTVRACGNAHVIIQKQSTADLYTNGNYVFVIGSYGNTYLQIKNAVHGAFLSNYNGVLLSCTEFRPLWVSWDDAMLSIGSGDEVNTNILLSHPFTPPLEIKHAFLLTGWGDDACWDIDTGAAVLSTKWQKMSGNKKIQASNAKIYESKNQIQCSLNCMTPTEDLPCGCVTYSYNKLTKQCLVVDASEISTIVTATDWKTWQLK